LDLSRKQSLKETEGADVYVVEDDVDGPWQVDNILGTSQEDSDSPFKPYTLQIEVDNNPGVLNQVLHTGPEYSWRTVPNRCLE